MPDEQRGFRVVLVEDRPEDAALTLRCLTRHGLTNSIETFTNGEAALATLRSPGPSGRDGSDRLPPTLVLLDLRLPGIDGFEVVRRIRSDPWSSDAIVVVLASPGETASVTAAYDAGADSFLFKPIDFGSLVDATAELGLGWRLQAAPGGDGVRRRWGAVGARRPAAHL